MKKFIFYNIIFLMALVSASAQDVGISGGFFASTINVAQESELHVTFTNNSFDVSIQPFGAYVQLDFPTTGEYLAPEDPPTGPGASFFNWSQNPENTNIWIGVVNTEIAPLTAVAFIFTVIGEVPTEGTPTLLFTDLSSGSDDDPQNNNADPDLEIQSSLPVELLDFSSKNVECDEVLLEWRTASEVNNYGFEILISENGKDFEKIGFVEGNGTSNFIAEYSFNIDVSNYISREAIYFRLKQVDFNGLFSLSPIVSSKNECDHIKNSLTIGPNPTNGLFNVNFKNELKNNCTIYILNSSHQLLRNYTINKGERNLEIDISTLSAGVYILKTNSEEIQLNKKLVLIK